MNKIKAINLIISMNKMREIATPEKVEKVIEALSEKDRTELFSRKMIPINWIDFGSLVRFSLLADKMLGKGDYKLIEAIGQATANEMFSSIYKIFISLSSPQKFLGRITAGWKTNFDTGTISFIANGTNSGLLELTDYPDIPKDHDHLQTPFLKEVISMCHAKDVKIRHSQCIAKGANSCRWEISWT